MWRIRSLRTLDRAVHVKPEEGRSDTEAKSKAHLHQNPTKRCGGTPEQCGEGEQSRFATPITDMASGQCPDPRLYASCGRETTNRPSTESLYRSDASGGFQCAPRFRGSVRPSRARWTRAASNEASWRVVYLYSVQTHTHTTRGSPRPPVCRPVLESGSSSGGRS